MFVTKVAVAALSALTVVSAGNSTFSIDPSSVTLATRGMSFLFSKSLPALPWALPRQLASEISCG